MASRALHVVHAEIGYGFRMLFSRVPSLWAPAPERSNFFLFKTEVLEAWAAVEPSAAAQALQIAARARREALGIAADYR